MKKLLFAAALAAGAAGAGAVSYPEDARHLAGAAERAALKLWAGVEANPVPVVLALGTFLLTLVYHKLKGKSLRESVEVAATRVTVVPVPGAPSGASESPVVARAKARATRAQLIADQIALENRHRKLPAEVKHAEKDACYTEQALTDARKALEARERAHAEAAAKLEALRDELEASESELAAIAAELAKLASAVQ
jgi:hypothetical protein